MTAELPLDPYMIGEKLGALTTQVKNVDRNVDELKVLVHEDRELQRTFNENCDRVLANHEERIKKQEERKPPLKSVTEFCVKYWWVLVAVVGGWVNWRWPGLWDSIFAVFTQIKGTGT